jgi:hypothetical protein
MPDTSGPIVRICRPADQAAASRLLGIPVATGDGYRHDPACGGCHGTADRDTCPYSVRLRDHVERLRAGGSDA